MKKLVGYTLLCFSLGMLFMLVLGKTWIGLMIIAFLVVIGYNLFGLN